MILRCSSVSNSTGIPHQLRAQTWKALHAAELNEMQKGAESYAALLARAPADLEKVRFLLSRVLACLLALEF